MWKLQMLGREGRGRVVERKQTYERSSGVAGCDDPLKLCAKLALPPSCLVGF